MDVFDLRSGVISDYGSYVRSFINIRDNRIDDLVARELREGFLWPDPLIQLNPSFEPGQPLHQLVAEGVLHPECLKIFARKDGEGAAEPLRLHRHQVEGIAAARSGDNYVLTTGTGSGKSLSYIVPIVDHVLRRGSGRGIQAIVVYPMNALANSQLGELEKFLQLGYPSGQPPVTFARYTGQESEAERRQIIANPPDILLTNYVMLELVLTRPWENRLVDAAKDLSFLILDELHTYRGRQGADVSMLVRRVREACSGDLIHVGTSATLSSGVSWPDQQSEVAEVASRLFGAEVKPLRVIGETLRRITPYRSTQDRDYVAELSCRVDQGTLDYGAETAQFLEDPLASWVESIFGLKEELDSGRLVRSKPLPLTGDGGGAAILSELTGRSREICEASIRNVLLEGHRFRDEHGHPIFVFRLHQFVAKGESVYASPETEAIRHITLQAQQFVPGSNREKALLPLAFCRECGQEYYVVRRLKDDEGRVYYAHRQLHDRYHSDDGEAGFLYINGENPWPEGSQGITERLPDSWLEVKDDRTVVRKSRTDRLPRKVYLSPLAIEGVGDQPAQYMRAPFLFCLNCRVDYDARQSSDFGKLATLGSEGRSTATTVMTLSAIRKLRRDREIDKTARKLLSFTDNRQDASLQAGHFNDFVEITLLRSALWRAAYAEESDGLRHDVLTQRVFNVLNLPLELYANNPKVEYLQLEETERALRQVLGYYLYRDLRRGWRVTSPNLEQCGLLDIDYLSLRRFCLDEDKWGGLHPALATANAEDREKVCRVLLDFLRRELAIRVNYLDPVEQESIQQLSAQYLIPPWSLDNQEKLERSHIVFPRSRGKEKEPTDRFVYLSARGGFGLYLKRSNTFSDFAKALKTEDSEILISQLLEALTTPGLVQCVMEPRREGGVPGYQLNSSALIWRAGDGRKAFHDPVRVPNAPEEGLRTNPFFTGFYRGDTDDLKSLEGREHTAQVPAPLREAREKAFRAGNLPLLYCSPTMELGVDIAQLNVVNLRNVPPTPANYAQRSGRAGRSGQPAFVFSYCAAGSPHDQYFFKRPELMVAGSVSPPRLDLSNDDLTKAHVHAVWLGTVGLSLGSSLADVLDVSGDEPSLEFLPQVQDALGDFKARERAFQRALTAFGPEIDALVAPHGTADEWLHRALEQIPTSMDAACQRWRGLYRAALNQSKRQSKIVRDASRDRMDRNRAKRLRDEAESQLRLLLETSEAHHSDFYSYRYFASEGFLPGYNFPRLPLSAYLPGTQRQRNSEDFLSRPRFLAISEFGPRSIVYHEGSRFVVNRVILPVDSEEVTVKGRGARCKACGYVHPLGDEPAPDLCERCGDPLPQAFDNLFRMQNVVARRRDRINSDEEERLRLGYELKTGVRFAERTDAPSVQTATLQTASGEALAFFEYGHAATLWRVNMGWRRRANQDQLGYGLDVERGYWARNQAVDDDPDDPLSPRIEQVIPYVEDRRNCILVKPASELPLEDMASLQAALKAALQVHFQLEDNELAAEPLPDPDDRRLILLYEAAEGGAGVLRRLVEEPDELPKVARTALSICHFDPSTGADLKRAPRAREDCEAACYDCLLSYYNQRDHAYLDRQRLPHLLRRWATGRVLASPTRSSRDEHLQSLMRLTDSELERRWLTTLDKMNLTLPSGAQVLLETCAARADFVYQAQGVVVFVDGPPHDIVEQKDKDEAVKECLEDAGYFVIRFHHASDWLALFARYPSIFGTPKELPRSEAASPADEELAVGGAAAPELDLFDDCWHPLIRALAENKDITIEPGGDVGLGGRVVGATIAQVSRAVKTVIVVSADDQARDEILDAISAGGGRGISVSAADENGAEKVLAELEE